MSQSSANNTPKQSDTSNSNSNSSSSSSSSSNNNNKNNNNQPVSAPGDSSANELQHDENGGTVGNFVTLKSDSESNGKLEKKVAPPSPPPTMKSSNGVELETLEVVFDDSARNQHSFVPPKSTTTVPYLLENCTTVKQLLKQPEVDKLRKQVISYNENNFTENISQIVMMELPELIFQVKKLLDEELNNDKVLKYQQEVLGQIRDAFESNYSMDKLNDPEWQSDFLAQYYDWKICEQLYYKGIYLPKRTIEENNPMYRLHCRTQQIFKNFVTQLWQLETGIRLMRPTLDDVEHSRVKVQKIVINQLIDMQNLFRQMLDCWIHYAENRLPTLWTMFQTPQSIDARLEVELFERDYLWQFQRQIQYLYYELLITYFSIRKYIDEILNPDSNKDAQKASKLYN